MILAHLKTNLKSAGFTMIELLIVMGILSVLAVAVLAAIDPVEQLNKGRDTGARSDARQLVDAIERHYAVREFFPWNANANQANSLYNVSANPAFTNNVINPLVTAGELKSAFSAKINKYIGSPYDLNLNKPAGGSPRVCFTPSSKAFKQEALPGTEICVP